MFRRRLPAAASIINNDNRFLILTHKYITLTPLKNQDIIQKRLPKDRFEKRIQESSKMGCFLLYLVTDDIA